MLCVHCVVIAGFHESYWASSGTRCFDGHEGSIFSMGRLTQRSVTGVGAWLTVPNSKAFLQTAHWEEWVFPHKLFVCVEGSILEHIPCAAAILSWVLTAPSSRKNCTLTSWRILNSKAFPDMLDGLCTVPQAIAFQRKPQARKRKEHKSSWSVSKSITRICFKPGSWDGNSLQIQLSSLAKYVPLHMWKNGITEGKSLKGLCRSSNTAPHFLQDLKKQSIFSHSCSGNELQGRNWNPVVLIPIPACPHFASQLTDLPLNILRLQHIKEKNGG